ncbi:MAG TPA: hypothetical protein VHM29_06835, partial [Acidimicrobiia bacterium]|nr:hypothetical protein [Acidimicrobiia bacterium]
WELYVELITRISVEELQEEEGFLREALSSLYTLFDTTRDVLRRYGPEVATPKGASDLSFGQIAVTVLNFGLRPLLARWHPELAAYEAGRPPGVSLLEHERNWDHRDALRGDLNELRGTLRAYAEQLAQVAGVPSLLVNRPTSVDSAQ